MTTKVSVGFQANPNGVNEESVGECEGRLLLMEDSLRVANLLVAKPVSFLTVFPAIKYLLTPCTSGKLCGCFQFFTMLTSNQLAHFLVLGPVRSLALGIAIRYSLAARTLQVMDSIIPRFTVLTNLGRTACGEAISRRPTLTDFFIALVGNEPTLVIRANWNARHLMNLATTLAARMISFSSQVWYRGLRTNPALEGARLSQMIPLFTLDVVPKFS
jgi:hypothetical protein